MTNDCKGEILTITLINF